MARTEVTQVRLRIAVCVAVFFFTNLAFYPAACRSEAAVIQKLTRDADVLKEDYRRFYLDTGNLMLLGAGVAAAGVLANTSADREAQEYYRDNLKSRGTDNASKVFKVPGEVFVTVPLLIGVHIFTEVDTPAGRWADKSLRALFTGGPAGLLLQRATGAGRPKEGDSKWRPFKNNNGLSGHAFVGAVPFITAARMQDDPYLKVALYALSFLPAATRVNDNEHYLSQALLGWYLAYLSCGIIDRKENTENISYMIVPIANRGIFLRVNMKF